MFSDGSLASLYKYFEAEEAEDRTFVALYENLSDWLVAVDENRDSITTCVICSNKVQNFTLSNRKEKKFTLVWDVSFWHYYSKFLLTFFSYDYLMDSDVGHKKNEKFLFSNAESFFKSSILDYLLERFSRDKDVVEILAKIKSKHSNATGVYVRDGIKDVVDSIALISKEFVLMHELEHILYHLSPEIYSKDTKTFDELLQYYRDVLIDNIDENITHIKAIEFKKIVDELLSNKEKPYYSELYGDFHAFFEILSYHGENFKDVHFPFTSKIPNYLFAIKLLKIFESCINYITQIVDCLLSTKFYENAYKIKRLEEISSAYQKTVFNRDYLSVELVSVCLMIYSEQFMLDEKKFAESIDTIPFVLPYTEIMQPIFNEFVQELVAHIIYEL